MTLDLGASEGLKKETMGRQPESQVPGVRVLRALAWARPTLRTMHPHLKWRGWVVSRSLLVLISASFPHEVILDLGWVRVRVRTGTFIIRERQSKTGDSGAQGEAA